MERARIFVSYCHEDIDRDVLNMLLADLSSDRRLEIISDKLVQVGDDIDKFMSLVGQCHAVILLCTPEYQKRIINRKKSVYTEYKAIVDADEKMNSDYEDQNHAVFNEPDPLKSVTYQARDQRFAILPVLMAGSVENSIPEAFRHKVAADLAGMITIEWNRSGEARPQKNYRNAYSTFLSTAAKIAVDVLETRNSDADELSKDVFNKIFFDLKHDAQTLDRETISRVFVKTLEFRRVSAQQSYILVGRKGSGKSTIADFLTYGPTNKWKTPSLYNVDDLPLEFLFSIVLDSPHRSDQTYVITRSNAMKFAWEALIHYLCFQIISLEYEREALQSAQHLRFRPISTALEKLETNRAFSDGLKFVSDLASVTMARRHAFFGYALARAIDFVSTLIAKAPDSKAEFEHYIIKNLTPEHFLVDLFGANFLTVFYEITKNCQRQFLIAIDGFDSNFQSFRFETIRSYRDTELFDARTRFEQDWLSGLIAAVRRCKRREGTAPLSGKVDFCVTIPKDRFLEFVEFDRDAYEWERKRIDISWTGIELCSLLRKRLEIFKRTSTDKGEGELQRLETLMAKEFSWLPNKIPIILDKRTVELNLYQYLLRHSFWRPRDILFLSGRVFSAAEYYREKGLEFDARTVKLIVSRSLNAIINLEFIKEFSGSVPNVESIIKRFENCSQVMTFEELFITIEGEKLERALSSKLSAAESGKSESERILSWLFSVGFIGFYLRNNSELNQRFETQWVFVFNEGDAILSMQSAANRKEMLVVIHPMFIEYLNLKPYRDSLVCDFGDDYLVRQEAHQVSSLI